MGIVKFSTKYFHQCIERGFPFPSGTVVEGVRVDEWNKAYEILATHPSMKIADEGEKLKYYNLNVNMDTKESAFVDSE